MAVKEWYHDIPCKYTYIYIYGSCIKSLNRWIMLFICHVIFSCGICILNHINWYTYFSSRSSTIHCRSFVAALRRGPKRPKVRRIPRLLPPAKRPAMEASMRWKPLLPQSFERLEICVKDYDIGWINQRNRPFGIYPQLLRIMYSWTWILKPLKHQML